MGVEHGLAADVKARLVLQHHVAVGVQGAEDLGGIGIVDLVPDYRGGGWLNEGGGLTGTNIEALPIDEGVVRGLDGELRTLGAEGGAALADGAAERIGLNEGRGQATCQQQDEDPPWPRTAAMRKINDKFPSGASLAFAGPTGKTCRVKLRLQKSELRR